MTDNGMRRVGSRFRVVLCATPSSCQHGTSSPSGLQAGQAARLDVTVPFGHDGGVAHSTPRKPGPTWHIPLSVILQQ